jgi:hypothetical protein
VSHFDHSGACPKLWYRENSLNHFQILNCQIDQKVKSFIAIHVSDSTYPFNGLIHLSRLKAGNSTTNLTKIGALYENTQRGDPELVYPGMYENAKFSKLGESQLLAILIFPSALLQSKGTNSSGRGGTHLKIGYVLLTKLRPGRRQVVPS